MRRSTARPRWHLPLRWALAAQFALALCLGWAHSPRVEAAAPNLLQNAGFERGAASWDLCGSAELPSAGSPGVTPAMIYAGSRALRLMYTDTNKCGEPVFDPDGAAVQSFSVPANAPAVTISFWYSRVGNPIWDLKVSLAEPRGYGYLAQVHTDNLPGWHQFRYELSAEQLARVRGKTVQLELASEFTPGSQAVPDAERPGFYVDDVRVVAARERTEESPRPAELAGNGTAPIVYLDAQLGGIARMEADGSGARLLYRNEITPSSPAWSSAGDRVAVIEGWLTPEDSLDPKVNRAIISRIKVIDARSGAAREIYRTAGLAGYRPPVPTPGDPERPALDVEASFVTWSPDDRQIALSLCARNRAADGSSSDPICWVELIEVATGTSKGKYEPGFAPRWHKSNRIIYSNQDAYSERPQGIIEVDLNGAQPAERVLVPGVGTQFNLASYNDRLPAWAPDGTKFVTVRNISGYHYEDEEYTVHYAIMLFTRGDPVGRQLLLVDHGEAPSSLTWSPDGTFLLYTLYRGEGADIWWLDTRSGATGRLTTSGAAAAADWRQNSSAGGPLAPRAFLPLVRRPR